jgi:predicted small metal-binding protein
MTGTFKQIQCEPPCGFTVKSHDEKELIEFVRQHAKKAHNLTISEKDVRGKMTSV